MVTWPSVDPGENKLLTFKFGNQLETGETIQSATITVVDANAVDPTPSNIKQGSYTITGSNVLQPAALFVDGASYYIKAIATTSTGRKHLVDALLPCIAANASN